jgi:cell division control protein 6
MYSVNEKDLAEILSKVEREYTIFSRKEHLDTPTFPSQIIGRKDHAEQLVRFLMGYKQGLAVPFISVYGKSGTGKSTLVRYVCENIEWISYRIVNLRRAKTVFGCANLILAELGISNLKNAQGINLAVDKIYDSIEALLSRENKLFVLVLDEFDALFYDRKGGPSDFVYKLLNVEEKLREKGFQMSIIAISNSVVTNYDLDDRVKSRTGSSEILFGGYLKYEIAEMLKERAEKALSEPIDPDVIVYCAELCSQDHGDARRAIELLRVAIELASSEGVMVSRDHVDEAAGRLQYERVEFAVMSASMQLRLVCASLAKISFLTDRSWHYTSSIYRMYCQVVGEDMRPSEQARRWKELRDVAVKNKLVKGQGSILSGREEEYPEYKALTYRRVSDLLQDLENMGLVVSRTTSRGRYGYGKEYRPTAPPEIIGPACVLTLWIDIMRTKSSLECKKNFLKILNRRYK